MRRLVLFLTCLGAVSGNLSAQENPFNDELLLDLRAAARMVPGAGPEAVNVMKVGRVVGPSDWQIEELGPEWRGVNTVFQIQYDDGWIMVDGGWRRSWERTADALLGARMILLTHEHSDHVNGLTRSPNADEIAGKTLLTQEQVHTLMVSPEGPPTQLTEEEALQYLTVAYDRILPVAPGVVLIKAPGHTPGGQMVYVRSRSGQEILLTGDVVWQKPAISRGLQKPEVASQALGEDREAIAPQLAWLRIVESLGVAVVVSHDRAAIDELIERGVLGDGVELK